ncbi:cellulase family glycosylhydrolase [Pseudoroseomonas globiformis]|uniref:cellulase n=1 Tax=Teichococcus globiformis TaxID=2307229 RepID=A0ABV7G0X6_9PROT
MPAIMAEFPDVSAILNYSVPDDWGAGFIGHLELVGGAGGLNGWTIRFDAGFQITNIWGAEIVSHVGTVYVLRNLTWNAVVPEGGRIGLGFQGSGSSTAGGFVVGDANAVPQPQPEPEPEPKPEPQPQPPAPASPVLSLGPASIAEGNAGTAVLEFVVTLDRPATVPVSVAYATADGTARAGEDYLAVSGVLIFAPGETSRAVTVPILGDRQAEADETFTLLLANPVGATLGGGGLAIGTILEDDTIPGGNGPEPAPQPVISVRDAEAVEGTPAGGGAAAGFFSTHGNQIVDAAGNPVKIAGVNWFGLESGNFAPHGLWVRGYKEMMDQMKAEGFNTIRLPFSSELLHTSTAPNGIDFGKNPDLQGLPGLGIMDRIVDYAGEIGLRIILDHHRDSAGAGASGNGLWYGDGYTEAQWVADWQMLAGRYAGNATVIGADLHNEPYGGSWGDGSATDWAAAAERAGNAALAANPDWLIFVEGIGNYDGQGYWWGGNLMGVRDRPVELDIPGRLVYSAHDYPNSIYGQNWFSGSGWEAGLAAKFDEMWGYIYREGIAPVFLGEFGSKLQDPKDLVWLQKITAYLAGDFDADGTRDIPAGEEGISWTWWSWNPNSGDTGGILADDWMTVIPAKTAWLDPLMFDLGMPGEGGTGSDANLLHFAVSLSFAAQHDVWVDYVTVAGTADAQDFTPVSGTLHFAPGETSKQVAVALTPDARVEGDEIFTLQLLNVRGAESGQMVGTGTIRDDDAPPAPPVEPPPQPPAGQGGLDGSFSLTDAWASGFQGLVELVNRGPADLSGWTVRLNTMAEITQIWNAEIVASDMEGYLIRNAAWNGSLSDDQEVSFGFLGVGPMAVDLVFV